MHRDLPITMIYFGQFISKTKNYFISQIFKSKNQTNNYLTVLNFRKKTPTKGYEVVRIVSFLHPETALRTYQDYVSSYTKITTRTTGFSMTVRHTTYLPNMISEKYIDEDIWRKSNYDSTTKFRWC